MFSNAIGVNVQVYTTSIIMISIQDRLHMDCCYEIFTAILSMQFLF